MPIEFPHELSRALARLPKKYYLTPTYFSAFLFHQLLKEQKSNLDDAELEKMTSFTHRRIEKDNLLSYEFTPTQPSEYYIVHFPGNGQNGLDTEYVQQHLKDVPHATHVFFNYPAINPFELDQCSPEKWFDAGHQQVIRLIQEHELQDASQNIVLAGWSMGSGVAAHVAHRLYDEGYTVGLLMDRGFLSTEATLEEQLNAWLTNNRLATIVTASINMGLLGMSVCCVFSRGIATIGLLAGSLVAGIGYTLGTVFVAIGQWIENSLNESIAMPFYFLGHVLNDCFGALGSMLNIAVNLIASMVGLVEIMGLGVGALTGALLGTLFSVNQLFGFDPVILPIITFDLFAGITGLRLDTDKALTDLIHTSAYQENGNKITAINTTNDWLVKPDASISHALERNSMFQNGKVKTVWFNEGDHSSVLGDPIAPADENTTFASVLQDMMTPGR